MQQATQERLTGLFRSFVCRVGPQFDSLIVIGTYINDDGKTDLMVAQDGNYHAANGAMRHILEYRDGQAYVAGANGNNDLEDDGN